MANDDPSLDVTLRSGGAVRSWLIAPSNGGRGRWRFGSHDASRVEAGESSSRGDAQEKRRGFDAQIADAPEQGWSEDPGGNGVLATDEERTAVPPDLTRLALGHHG